MTPIKITELDHIVLNVADVERSLKFYVEHMGLRGERVDEFRAGKAGFPSVRINAETIIDLFPRNDPPAADGKANSNMNHFCMVVDAAEFPGVVEYLKQNHIEIREGPVSRWGARGQATSVYFLDPDGNMIEIRAY